MSESYNSSDNLFVDFAITPLTAIVTLSGTGALNRGTVLNADGGVFDGTGSPMYVLAEDVADVDGYKAEVYTSGHYSLQVLENATGYEFTRADLNALRGVGIAVQGAVTPGVQDGGDADGDADADSDADDDT